MRSVDGFYAISDMDRLGMLPARDEDEELKVYESLPGLMPEERVVPPGYVSLQAMLDEAGDQETEEAEAPQATDSAKEHVILEN